MCQDPKSALEVEIQKKTNSNRFGKDSMDSIGRGECIEHVFFPEKEPLPGTLNHPVLNGCLVKQPVPIAVKTLNYPIETTIY